MPPFQHRPHRSNVRTRSQQPQPIVPVDLTASPLKAVRRQNRTATAPAETPMPHLQQDTTRDPPAPTAKRSPSPSSTSRLDDCKRQRLSIEKDEKETQASTSSKTTLVDTTLTVTPKARLAHVDLSRISQSPFRPVSSPMKVFKITTHTGGTVEVPVTPARRQTLIPDERTETHRSPVALPTPTADNAAPTLPTTEDSSARPATSNINNGTDPNPPPCADPVIDSNPTPNSGNPIPQPSNTASIFPAPSTIKKPESFIQFKTPLKPRETVVAPETSRLPRPSSSLKVSLPSQDTTKTPARVPNPMAATISSLAKVKPRASPMRLRSRPQMKIKLGIKDKTPTSKLALKRTIRRTSLNKEKMKRAPSPSAKAPKAFAAVPVKAGKQTTLNGFFQQRSVKSARDTESNSPSKPTPLVALSTALKRLEVSAPLPPPRPVAKNVENALAIQPEVDEVAVASESLPEPSDVAERTSDAADHSKTTPKARLPMRLPSTLDNEGRARRVSSSSPSRKSADLRTTPRPLDSSEPENKPISNQKSLEILDVDTWTDKAKEEQKENKPPIEFFVPLADEPSTIAKLQASSQISPSRRASQASLALTESLNKPHIFPQARSVSTSHLQLNARSPVKTRGKAKPLPPSNETANQTNGKRLNARMPGSLDVLKNCVIYVDVRTEEGEDAAPLFVDMLRGLGARILSKPGKSCTHLVFKAGLPSTVVKYKLLPQPKPLVVSIGWVVECVEKRSHVEETKFQVNLDDIDVTGGSHRRRSMTMQPKQVRALILGPSDPSDSGDSSLTGDTSFTSEGSSTTGLLNNLSPLQRSTVVNDLPPLERARQRSQRLPRMK